MVRGSLLAVTVTIVTFVTIAYPILCNYPCFQGSYCQCHYCKCEHGQLHCKGHGHSSGGYGEHDYDSDDIDDDCDDDDDDCDDKDVEDEFSSCYVTRKEILLREHGGRILSLRLLQVQARIRYQRIRTLLSQVTIRNKDTASALRSR